MGRPALLVLLVLLVAGCRPDLSREAREILATPPVVTPPVLTHTNPVFPQDFPDPFILPVGDGYFAYATNSGHMNVQVLHSPDLVTWRRTGTTGDALPKLPPWAAAYQSLTWAPSVLARDGEFILYFVARNVAVGRQCIGMAVGSDPAGPFVAAPDGPLICQTDEGGSIDPEPFVDANGDLYLLWKNDGNCCDLPVWLYAQRLSDDGKSLQGEPARLITVDQAWEKPLIENPSMVLHEGKYYLIYSANWWESADYAVGYAVCDSPLGPCRKPQDGPILAANETEAGPGGASFFHDHAGALWMAYHAWTPPHIGYARGQRSLHLARVVFADGVPTIYRPTP
jgi:beta-xylosidase